MATVLVIREELDIYQHCASPLSEEGGGGVLPVCLSLKRRRFVVSELLPASDTDFKLNSLLPLDAFTC